MFGYLNILRGVALMVLLIFTTANAHALWPTEDERLERGEIIVISRESQESNFSEVRGSVLFRNTPSELVWQLLTSYEDYADFFSDINECRKIKSEPPLSWVEIERNNLFPFPNHKYTLKFVEELKSGKIEWQIEQGNLKNYYGSWVVLPYGKNKEHTKVILVMLHDTGSFLFFLPEELLINRSMVYDRLSRLRNRINFEKMKNESEPENLLLPRWFPNPFREKDDNKTKLEEKPN